MDSPDAGGTGIRIAERFGIFRLRVAALRDAESLADLRYALLARHPRHIAPNSELLPA